jgi:transposase
MKNQNLFSHYEQLLNLTEPWKVSNVELDADNMNLAIKVETSPGVKLPCPVCQNLCAKEDHREERSWRHLDTMQFKTTIVCRVPRISCPEHGILTVSVPWAGEYSRFTLLFEGFAIDVLLSAKSIKDAVNILRISWDQIHEIQNRAVQRGLAKRKKEIIKHVGIDEKNFLKGHSYASLLTDLDQGRVLEVVPERTEEAAKSLLKSLSDDQREKIEAAAMDMWPAFMSACDSIIPNAEIVHDKYHVAGYLGKAVDLVRRKENRELVGDGNDVLKNTKYLWLTNPENLTKEAKKIFRNLALDDLKVGRAWSIKESFRHLWDYRYKEAAKSFFQSWYFWATHSKLRPIINAAKTIKRHIKGTLAYLKHHITNAVTEGLNSKIQSIKSNARGFRNFQNYRIAILFHCGKLNLHP